NLGVMPYAQALDLQRRLCAERKRGEGEDTLLLLEHPPVITLGRRAQSSNILASPELLARHDIEVFQVERGGDVTYHGPGQLVGYPILDLRNFRQDVRWYISSLAEVLVRTLEGFGVSGAYRADLPGVWVGDEKVVAIGARIENWVTYHGFAFNVCTDMAHWEMIVPCGIPDKGVGTLSRLLGRRVPVGEVIPAVAQHFGDVFGVPMVKADTVV
ncbi:MAG: lipoyl(octanoyl) transferase LipB, partial [Chloroflexi bacterium]|nr:lipoyl(octanoyl) transferase LipB [Chloroflexota bacterium]